jgi:hypothetical protein
MRASDNRRCVKLSRVRRVRSEPSPTMPLCSTTAYRFIGENHGLKGLAAIQLMRWYRGGLKAQCIAASTSRLRPHRRPNVPTFTPSANRCDFGGGVAFGIAGERPSRLCSGLNPMSMGSYR